MGTDWVIMFLRKDDDLAPLQISSSKFMAKSWQKISYYFLVLQIKLVTTLPIAYNFISQDSKVEIKWIRNGIPESVNAIENLLLTDRIFP